MQRHGSAHPWPTTAWPRCTTTTTSARTGAAPARRSVTSPAASCTSRALRLDYRSSIYQDTSMPRSKQLPAASLHVVLALLDGELHGYALMRRVDELSDGRVRMGPGTLYGTLNRLVADG